MVTSFYITMMSKSKKTDLDTYYSSILDDSSRTSGCKNKCRVCLREGSIPIYANNNIQNLVEVLASFADIEMCENDQYPKHLCKVCYKFVKDAVSFRKRAKHTQELLTPVKVEVMDIQTSSEESFCETDTQSEDFDFEQVIPRVPARIPCKVCNKVFDRQYLKQHMLIHDPNLENAYICEICGKGFRLRSLLYSHSMVHRCDFPYKCSECPYRVQKKSILKSHMKTHTRDFKYTCTQCPARFRYASIMNIHVLKKHTEPQFKCNVCEKKFHRQIDMKQHYEADHLGLRSHACNICGKAFGYQQALRKHERSVHKRDKLKSGVTPAYIRAQIENKDQNASGCSQPLG